MRRLMMKAAAEVSKKELIDTLQKHEDRETPEQEKAESKEEESVEQRAGVHDEKNKAYAPKTAGVMDKLKKLMTLHHDVAASKALPMEHTLKVDQKLLDKVTPKSLLMGGAALGFGHEFGRRIGKGRQRREKQSGPRIAPMPGGGAIIVE